MVVLKELNAKEIPNEVDLTKVQIWMGIYNVPWHCILKEWLDLLEILWGASLSRMNMMITDWGSVLES
ncbi:hypothetical protein SESBI_25519 [Sesbania bispinosa]|nr:hypothetical protein SESBI_25519 [Sesbania bispinosa]